MSSTCMFRFVRSILSRLIAVSALSALVSGCLGGGNSGSETTNGLAGTVRKAAPESAGLALGLGVGVSRRFGVQLESFGPDRDQIDDRVVHCFD